MLMIDFINKLIEERARLVGEMRGLLEERSEHGVFAVDEDRAHYERINAEVSVLSDRIDELTGLHETNKKIDEQRAEYESIVRPEIRVAAEDAEERSLRELVEGKRSFVDLTFRGLYVEPARADRAFEVRLLQKAAAAGGGNVVPTSFVRSLYEHMVENAAIRQTNVRVVNTSSGENLEFPKTAVYGTAAIVGEAGTIAEADPTFGKVTLGAYKYAQLLYHSSELEADSGVDLLGFLARDFGRALGNASGAHFITGNGSTQPNGVVTATVAQVGTASAGTVRLSRPTDDFITLQYAVIDPYARNGYWMMRRATEGAMCGSSRARTTTTCGSPGLQAGSPNLLLGRPIVTDPNLAAVGSANMSVIFGDFSAYVIRDVAGVRIERSDDFAFSSDSVAWRAILRTDGDLLDGTGAIKGSVPRPDRTTE
jgi:HK97 family phage major capsid protein